MFLQDKGCLLRKSPTSEKHDLLVFFLRENGLQSVLCRKSSKASSSVNVPDLFESGEVQIEKKGGNKPAFLKEFMPELRFEGIARNYSALQAASRLTRFFELNLIHMEFYDNAWELLHTALDSFSNKKQSDVILLKSLFVFARMEGYPVRENWLLKLPAETQKDISNVIQSPVDSQEITTNQVALWIRNIEQYFIHHTDFLLPD